MVSTQDKSIPDVTFTLDDYYTVVDLLLNDIEDTSIDVYLDKGGGNTEDAAKIVRLFRKKLHSLRFIISSAANTDDSKLLISGDDISMRKNGNNDHTDTQINIDGSTITISDYIKQLNEERKTPEEDGSSYQFDAVIVDKTNLNKFRGVNPNLKLAEDLFPNWMTKKRSLIPWDKSRLPEEDVSDRVKSIKAKEIITELIAHRKWREHELPDMINRLENIGLTMSSIEDNKQQKYLVYRIHIICRLLFITTNIYKIIGTKEGILFKSAITPQEKPELPKKRPGNTKTKPISST